MPYERIPYEDVWLHWVKEHAAVGLGCAPDRPTLTVNCTNGAGGDVAEARADVGAARCSLEEEDRAVVNRSQEQM